MSYLRHVAKWSSTSSMEWRGCWRVIRRYFCSGREIDGKMEDADSEGVSGVLGAGKKGQIHCSLSACFYKMSCILAIEMKREGNLQLIKGMRRDEL